MKWLKYLLLMMIILLNVNQGIAALDVKQKPRVIVTTDGEYDDQCSMIRFLLYSSEFDIQGIIFSSSKHHWKGNQNSPGYKWLGIEWLDRQLDAYAGVFQNLKQHNPDFPTPEYLKSQVYEGNILFEGDMENPTPGSNHIVEVLLSSDQNPVWLLAWGGSNTIARALKSIQENHPERMDEVSNKVRLYLISQQDKTYQTYITKHWPQVRVLICNASTYGAIAYRWFDNQTSDQQYFFNENWMKQNILENHGALCNLYKERNGRFRSEGDSPSFLHLIDVGLGNITQPEYGGWGGRFRRSSKEWRSSLDQNNQSSLTHWIIAFQNDWAARADWCIKPVQEANHPPEMLYHDSAIIKAGPGETIPLHVNNIHDPDGDILKYRWWHYPEPGTFQGNIKLDKTNQKNALFTTPIETKNDGTVHVICEITDSGTPPLTRYQRIIIDIKPSNE